MPDYPVSITLSKNQSAHLLVLSSTEFCLTLVLFVKRPARVDNHPSITSFLCSPAMREKAEKESAMVI
jgi:hypothetical protein